MHQDRQQHQKRARASAFANWVFCETVGRRVRTATDRTYIERRKKEGATDHQLIERLLQSTSFTRNGLGPEKGTWKPIYVDKIEDEKKVFYATSLRLEEKAVACRPDVVLRRDKDNSILIIERKTTNVPPEFIPAEGWPNVQAQLWCYGHIDDWREASSVFLVGQYWIREGSGVLRYMNTNTFWARGESRHESFCKSLFEKYGGKVAT